MFPPCTRCFSVEISSGGGGASRVHAPAVVFLKYGCDFPGSWPPSFVWPGSSGDAALWSDLKLSKHPSRAFFECLKMKVYAASREKR